MLSIEPVPSRIEDPLDAEGVSNSLTVKRTFEVPSTREALVYIYCSKERGVKSAICRNARTESGSRKNVMAARSKVQSSPWPAPQVAKNHSWGHDLTKSSDFLGLINRIGRLTLARLVWKWVADNL